MSRCGSNVAISRNFNFRAEHVTALGGGLLMVPIYAAYSTAASDT